MPIQGTTAGPKDWQTHVPNDVTLWSWIVCACCFISSLHPCRGSVPLSSVGSASGGPLGFWLRVGFDWWEIRWKVVGQGSQSPGSLPARALGSSTWGHSPYWEALSCSYTCTYSSCLALGNASFTWLLRLKGINSKGSWLLLAGRFPLTLSTPMWASSLDSPRLLHLNDLFVSCWNPDR